jgi:formate dehydrogenase subunit gamma
MRLTVSTAALAALLIAVAGAAVAQPTQTQPEGTTVIPSAPADIPASASGGTTTVLPDPQPDDTNAQRAKSQPLNNAPFWRGVHDSGNVAGTVNNLQLGERGVLIQPITTYPGTRTTTAGEAWRQLRNWWIIPLGGLIVLFVVLAVALYYWIKGPIGGHGRHTGRFIERFTPLERVAHWTTAITFVILGVSGAVISFGKFFLLPIIGGQLFGWLTWFLKTTHNFVGPVFAVSMVVMFLIYLPGNWPTRDDWTWLKRVGGMLGGEHPPSHRFNAGEKIVFWGGMAALGVVVVVSGFAFDKIIPGLDLTRPQMQVVHIVHAIAAMFIIAMFIGHAYMGTIGVTGSFQAMKTGYVDEGWAEEHHRLWLDDIAAGKIPAQRSAPRPGRSGHEQPAA